jgi:hypothetical protein
LLHLHAATIAPATASSPAGDYAVRAGPRPLLRKIFSDRRKLKWARPMRRCAACNTRARRARECAGQPPRGHEHWPSDSTAWPRLAPQPLHGSGWP